MPTSRGFVTKTSATDVIRTLGLPDHSLLILPLNALQMVQRDNMSDRRGLIMILIEGPAFTSSGTPKIRLHMSSVILPSAGAVTPFVKANAFLPACTGLMPVEKPDTTAEWFALTCNIR